MNRKAKVACNFNCLIETEGLLKVADSHVYRKSSDIAETVQEETLLRQIMNRK